MLDLAGNLKTTREARGMTRYKLAQAASISRSYLVEMECGNKKNPSPSVLRRLANALNCSIDDLVPATDESA